MNFHNDEWIMANVQEHYDETLEHFSENQIVLIALQGSQNYGLDVEGSDVDTKLIVVPSFREIALNTRPISTTHIRENNEHIDFKDIRLYMETFRKQNLNFLEILFTPYKIINPMYAEQWARLEAKREEIAHMNPVRAVASMKGVAEEKLHALEHRYPSKIEIIDKFGYDPKQLSHLVRVEDYLSRYLAGVSYEKCLIPDEDTSLWIKYIKAGNYSLEEARELAQASIANTRYMADTFRADKEEVEDPAMRELLLDVSYNIMRIAVSTELEK